MLGLIMEHRDTDDWFDTMMVLVSNHAKPVANEWFKLCGWFLILAAFSFLSKVSAKPVYDWVFYLTCVVLVVYLVFHYQRTWYGLYNEKFAQNIDNWLLRELVHKTGVFVAFALAYGIIYFAIHFGVEASDFLHSKPSA